jgi:hypothetical protein
MNRDASTMHENWPGQRKPGGCGCAKCRAVRPAWWRDPRRRQAQIAAQNRFVDDAVESVLAELEAEAPEATGAKACWSPRLNHCVRWEGKKTLAAIRADTSGRYAEPKRQWLYRLYIVKHSRPIYVGKAGPRKDGLLGRLRDHFPVGARNVNWTAHRLQTALHTAARHRRGRPLTGDTAVLKEIISTMGPNNFLVEIGEVCRVDSKQPGGCPTPWRGANLLLERTLIFSGQTRINTPQRAEDELAEAAVIELEDLTLDVEAWS